MKEGWEKQVGWFKNKSKPGDWRIKQHSRVNMTMTAIWICSYKHLFGLLIVILHDVPVFLVCIFLSRCSCEILYYSVQYFWGTSALLMFLVFPSVTLILSFPVSFRRFFVPPVSAWFMFPQLVCLHSGYPHVVHLFLIISLLCVYLSSRVAHPLFSARSLCSFLFHISSIFYL